MNAHEEERLTHLLRQAVPPTSAEPARDLWPAMQQRLAQRPAAPPWFDWALAGGLAALLLLFPAVIPMLLYCI